ncbi:MAG: amidohydrolase family protein, partial [Kordiimonas sp.]
WAEDRLGPIRIKHAYAWRSILDAGGRVVFNSDLPGEPWEPMQTLYFATTRQKLDALGEDGWQIEQALNVEESLKAMTSDAAFASFQENELGKLKAGFIADFIELNANPFEVAPKNIKDIKVTATWLDGKKLNSDK